MMVDDYTIHTLCCDYLNIEELLSDTTILSVDNKPNGVLIQACCGEVGKKPTYVKSNYFISEYEC
jgi:hypothetical protein